MRRYPIPRGTIVHFGLVDTLFSLRTIGRYGCERVADTLVILHTITCFFCHYFRILPENRITLDKNVNSATPQRGIGVGAHLPVFGR